MADPRDYKLDLTSVEAGEAKSDADGDGVDRPYLSVMFNCCKVYQRVYRKPDENAYVGWCPRCGKTVRFPIAPGGTSARSFVVD